MKKDDGKVSKKVFISVPLPPRRENRKRQIRSDSQERPDPKSDAGENELGWVGFVWDKSTVLTGAVFRMTTTILIKRRDSSRLYKKLLRIWLTPNSTRSFSRTQKESRSNFKVRIISKMLKKWKRPKLRTLISTNLSESQK